MTHCNVDQDTAHTLTSAAVLAGGVLVMLFVSTATILVVGTLVAVVS